MCVWGGGGGSRRGGAAAVGGEQRGRALLCTLTASGPELCLLLR